MSELRRSTARGTLINAAFFVGVTSLALLKGFVVAAFLTRHDYGIWGLLIASLSSIGLLKQVGIEDRYVQQRDADQELAFQQAFTLEVIFDVGFALLMAAVVPILALAYGRPELLAPGFALVLVVPALGLQSPLWVFYRRMEFGRQRRLGAIDPIIEFVVTVALAIAGAGYWSLIIGALVGNYVAAIAIVRVSPYRLAWRFSRDATRQYVSFSWPTRSSQRRSIQRSARSGIVPICCSSRSPRPTVSVCSGGRPSGSASRCSLRRWSITGWEPTGGPRSGSSARSG
jgi:O-antigen/teichoic acid export membrane protein